MVTPEDDENSRRDARIEAAYRRKNQLMELITPLKELTFSKENKTGDDTKIVFFKIDPKWDEDIIANLLESLEGVIIHSLINSDVHFSLFDDQRKIQYVRHSAESIFRKLARSDNPHSLIIALKSDERFIRTVGVISIDPEHIKAAEYDEYVGMYLNPVTGHEIKSEYVDDGYQGHGIGTVLFELALQEVYEKFVGDVLVKVPHSMLALNFYGNRGMNMIGLTKDTLPDAEGYLVEFYFYLMIYLRSDLEKKFGKDSTQAS